MVKTGKLNETTRRVRGAWDLEAMSAAVEAVRNKTRSIRNAAASFGVPKSTLERHVNQKIKVPCSLDGRRPILNDQYEQELASHVLDMQRRLTIMCTMNAVGSFVPPAMIFPRKYMNERLLKGSPSSTLGLTSDSGWVNEDLFLKWLAHFITYSHASKTNKQLLIVDGHSSHKALAVIELARDNGVVLCHCHHTQNTSSSLLTGSSMVH